MTWFQSFILKGLFLEIKKATDPSNQISWNFFIIFSISLETTNKEYPRPLFHFFFSTISSQVFFYDLMDSL